MGSDVLSGEEEARLAVGRSAVTIPFERGEPARVLTSEAARPSSRSGCPGRGRTGHCRSIDIGSLRLAASRMLVNGRRGKKQCAAAHAEVERLFDGLLLPLPSAGTRGRRLRTGDSERSSVRASVPSSFRRRFVFSGVMPVGRITSQLGCGENRNSHRYRRGAHPGRAPAADRRAVRGRRGGRARRAAHCHCSRSDRRRSDASALSLRACRGSGCSHSSAPSRRLAGRRFGRCDQLELAAGALDVVAELLDQAKALAVEVLDLGEDR